MIEARNARTRHLARVVGSNLGAAPIPLLPLWALQRPLSTPSSLVLRGRGVSRGTGAARGRGHDVRTGV